MTETTKNKNYPVIETTFRVRYAETDQSGVVYNANYLIWFELGRGEYFWQRGGDYGRDVEARGFILPVTEAHLRYLASARYGDLVTVKTTVDQVQSRAMTFSYEVLNAQTGQLLCTGFTKHVVIDRDGRVVRLPADIQEKLL